MNKMKTLVAFVALMLCGGAWAATPIVVWDHDMSDATATRKGADGNNYTITLNNGNTFENGCLKIGSTATTGATIVIPANRGKAYTVLMRYSNLSTQSAKAAIGGVSAVPNNIKNIGVAAAANTLVCKPFWNGTDYAYSDDTTPSLTAGSGYVQFSYKSANRWRTWAGSSLADSTAKEGTHCGLSFTADIEKVSLGGPATTGGPAAWKGLVIESIAIYQTDNQLNHSDTKDIVFPCSFKYKATIENDSQADAVGLADLAWTDAEGASVEYASIGANDPIAIYGTGKVTGDSSKTFTIYVDAGIELIYTTNPSATHSGSGMVTFNGFVPPNTDHLNFANGLWTGTVKISNKDNGSSPVYTAKYSNGNSTICLNGTTGYLNDIWNGGSSLMTVRLEDYGETPAWRQRNGTSSGIQKFAALTGSGTWKADDGATQTSGITDGSQFTGAFDFSIDTCVKFGANTSYVADDRGYIIVNDDATVQIAKTWKATVGLKLNGTVIAKGGTLGANTIFGSTATLDLSAGDEKALTLATGKTVSFDGTLNLVGAHNGSVVLKGIASDPGNLNMVTTKLEGETSGRLIYDSVNHTIVFTTGALIAWKPNLEKEGVVTDGIFDWTATGAWKDTNDDEQTWTWKDDVSAGAPNIVFDAKDIKGVKIEGKINAGEVHLVNTADTDMPFDFHNRTLGVDGDTTYNAEMDCLKASAVVMTTYNGKLGLKVPIVGLIGLGDDTDLTFKTGEIGGDASTAYAYEFGRVVTISVEGSGEFAVPAEMYGIPFAPESTASIIFNKAGTVTATSAGAGKAIVRGATVVFTAPINCASGLWIEETGTAEFTTPVGALAPVKGTGVLKYTQANGGVSTKLHDWFAASAFNEFNGTLELNKGRFEAASAIAANVKIRIDASTQFWPTGSTVFNNYIYVSGNGWTAEGGYAMSKAAIRLNGSIGAEGTLDFGNALSSVGTYDNDKDIFATIKGTSGFGLISDSARTFTFKAAKMTELTGEVVMRPNNTGNQNLTMVLDTEANDVAIGFTVAAANGTVKKIGSGTLTLPEAFNRAIVLAEGVIVSPRADLVVTGLNDATVYKGTVNGRTTYFLSEPVATVGEGNFRTLSDAISAAQEGQTVSILNDVTLDAAITVPAGVTLDIGSNTVNGGVTLTGAQYVSGGTATLKGSGTITGVVVFGQNSILDLSGGAITLGSIPTVTGYAIVQGEVDSVAFYCPRTMSGVFLIVGRLPNGDEYNAAMIFEDDEANNRKIAKIKRSYIVWNNSTCFATVESAVAYINGLKEQYPAYADYYNISDVVITDPTMVTIPDGYVLTSDRHLSEGTHVAKIGNAAYGSVSAAMANATEESVIDLVANDTTALSLTKDITINVDDENTFAISGVISGGFKITKTGLGTLAFSGTNTYTGGTDINNGTVKTSVKANLTGKVFTVAKNGVLEFAPTANVDFGNDDLSGIAGSGAIKLSGTTWIALPTGDGKMFASTLEVVNETTGGNGGILLGTNKTFTIGPMSGSGTLRYDSGASGTGADGARELCIVQSKDTTWTGNILAQGSKTRELNIRVTSTTGSTFTRTGQCADAKARFTVDEGATLKLEHNDAGNGNIVVLNGGTLKTTGYGNAHGKIVRELSLTANSTFESTSGIFGVGHDNNTSKLSLNNSTLTVVAPNNGTRFYLDKVTIGSAGTISVTSGKLFIHCGSIDSTDSKIVIGANASIEADNQTIRIGELEYNGMATSTVSDMCMVTVTKKLGGTGTMAKLTLADGAEVRGQVVVTTTATLDGTIKLMDEDAMLKVPAELDANRIVSGVQGKSVAVNKIGDKAIYTLWNGETAPEIDIPEGTTSVQIVPGQPVRYEGDVAPTTVMIVAPISNDGTSVDITQYFNIVKTDGVITATLKDDATTQPTVTTMSAPTEESTDKVAFTITSPIPGLFYAVSSCDTPDGTFESATGDQATSDAAKTVSIPMTFGENQKVKYYRVNVKATK